MEKDILIEDRRFCPECGYEGGDINCPVCQAKMVLVDDEAERISEKENRKSEILDDEVSLEEEKEKENSEEETTGEEDKNL